MSLRRAATLAALLLGAAVSTVARSEQDPVPRDDDGPAVIAETLDGERLGATDLVGLDATSVRLGAGADEPRSVPLDRLVSLRYQARAPRERALSSEEVAVDLWTGEVVRGTIRAGDEEGLSVRSATLGDVRLSIEWIAGLRFLERLERATDAPDLGARADADRLFLTGGDRLSCTIVSFGADGLVCDTTARDGATVPYEQMTAVRLVEDLPPELDGTLLDVVLADGTRLLARQARLADDHLQLTSASGFEARARLGSLVALQVRSDAFRYLPDLARPEVVVEPFYEPVGESGERLYAPRFDRSFSGTPLRSGGRSWLRGIGVHSGTTLHFDLDGEYREFRTHVGLDDVAGGLGGVVFEILVDGERRWTSGFVHGGRRGAHGREGPLQADPVDVSGARRLTLRVLSGDERDPYPVQDQADWLGPMLLR